MSELVQRPETGGALTQLNQAHELAVKVAREGETFLRKLPFLPQLTEYSTKS